jgi:5,10-methenyltetrahydromethanopterin hydrogenase
MEQDGSGLHFTADCFRPAAADAASVKEHCQSCHQIGVNHIDFWHSTIALEVLLNQIGRLFPWEGDQED